jgi:hypothetical protein
VQLTTVIAVALACAALPGCERSKPATPEARPVKPMPIKPMPTQPVDRCARVPALAEDALDLAEAAIIDGGVKRVELDSLGCRVYRFAASDGGTVRLELVQRGRVTYAREVSARDTHDFVDGDGDGVFERELFETRDDAGWLSNGQLDRDDAGLRRVREERVTRTTKRTLRETWADGGWVVTSDAVGPKKPGVVPITR